MGKSTTVSRTYTRIHIVVDLADEIRNAGSGVYMGGDQISLLTYADDIVLISDDEKGVQKQLDVMSAWCRWWGMRINAKHRQLVLSLAVDNR